jgi:YVTN family beta-propeller protein
MAAKRFFLTIALALAGFVWFLAFAESTASKKDLKQVGFPLLESPHVNPIVVSGDYAYVTNTLAGTVDVIKTDNGLIIDRISVGIEPVSLAIRPDSRELWVSNHVSDSVNVIDTDPKSGTYHTVVATIQEFDDNKRTLFDEPVGIAFSGNKKAYVALSSTNQVAVIDVEQRRITKRLKIAAQDPRAIEVKDDLLFVIPFESGNKTQLSGGHKKTSSSDGLVTFDAFHHFVANNNVLSLGYVEDIIKHPDQPDKDLFVFDTKSDTLVSVYESLGTLLYGMTVDEAFNIYVAQTDARNHVNGRAGTAKHSLKELENRPYLNKISKVAYKKTKRNDLADLSFIDLEPLPPALPTRSDALATPYAITTINQGKYIVATAAGSDTVFVVDTATGKVISRANVGAGPVGISAQSTSNGRYKIWVYNAYQNSVSRLVFDLDNRSLKVENEIPLEDSLSTALKQGRKYFYSAKLSSSGTFSCASCHPNGHVDQLLWVLDTPIVSGGKQIQPRSTMPIRGIRDTEPFHWDGTQGDPYGGINAASIASHKKPNCTSEEITSCIKHLLSINLSSTMVSGNKDSQKDVALSSEQLEALAIYNLAVPYPPAPARPFDNQITVQAKKGFELFHVDGDKNPKMSSPNVCGSCHRMPFLTSTNTPGQGMDAPTWRGAYDRHLILPQGRTNIIDFPWIKPIANAGRDEFDIWRLSWSGDSGPRTAFDPIWDMVLEGSTGFSGAFARQATLDTKMARNPAIATLLTDLESSAKEGTVVLECEGVLSPKGVVQKIKMQYKSDDTGGRYIAKTNDRLIFSRQDLLSLAEKGEFIGTFIARHGLRSDLFSHPQPALWTSGPMAFQNGKQSFPNLDSKTKTMLLSGSHFDYDATIFVDGKMTFGVIAKKKGYEVSLTLNDLPAKGMHLLQVQSPQGRMSNDFIFYVK